MNDGQNTILFIDHSLKIGGATTVLFNLLQHLGRSFRPVVICAPGSALATAAARKNILTIALPMPWFTKRSSPFTWLFYAYALMRFTFAVRGLIKKSNVSLIHANGFIPALYAMLPAKLARVPFIWHMHDILQKEFINGLFIKIAALNADRIICVSGAVKKSLQEFGVTETKCKVIYNFIPEPSGATPRGSDGFRAEFKIARNARIVGTIGNICRMKGQMVFVEAVQEIAAQHPDTVFCIVGDILSPADAPYNDELLRRIKESRLKDRIILTGFREDAFYIIKEFDILVHPPTLPESLGLVLLEAMFHKKPVIASDTGGIPEVVVHGVTGLLVPPGDRDSLAHAIDQILTNPALAAAMGSRGNRLFRGKFTTDASMKALTSLYQEVLHQ